MRAGTAQPEADRAFHVINYCVLAMFTISVLYPLIYVFSASFSSASADANNAGAVLLAGRLQHRRVLRPILASPRLLVTGFLQLVFYTVGGALIGTTLTVLAGYALSRPDLPFRRR